MKKEYILYFFIISTVLYGCTNKNNNDQEKMVYLKQEIIEETFLENNKCEQLISDKWYLLQLASEEDRKIYDIIYNSLVNQIESIDIKIGDAERINFVFKSVLYDNPEIFYVDNYKYIQHDSSITMLPIYNMNPGEIEKAKEELESYTIKLLKQIKPEMPDYEKELVIYKYIVESADYNIESKYNQSMYSIILGESVCMGYTKMFQYLCQQVSIPCTIILGQDKNGTGHVWNAVFIDDSWYMVDCSKGKGLLGENGLSYYFFNITQEQILRSYDMENIIELPQCNSVRAEYFYKNNLYFSKADLERYKGLIEQAKENNQDSITIRCSDINIYNQMIERLIDKKELLYMFEAGTSIERLIDPELLIIKVEWQGEKR